MQQQSYFNGCCWCPSMASPNMMNSNNDSKPWLLFDKIATNGPTLIRNLYQISNVTILWTWSEIDRWETEDLWSKGDLDHTWWSRNYSGPLVSGIFGGVMATERDEQLKPLHFIPGKQATASVSHNLWSFLWNLQSSSTSIKKDT